MSSSVRGALVWSFAERYASLVVTVASTMILARLLTPIQVGIFSLCAAVSTVAGILRDFGVSEYLIQEKELDKDKMRAAFGIALIIGWSIGLSVFLMRNIVASFFNEPGVASVLGVLSLNFFFLPFASPAFALLTRELAFRKIFLIQTSCNAVQATAAVTLAYLGHGYMSLAWAPVISIATQVLLTTLVHPHGSVLWPSFRNNRAVLNYGSLFVTSRVLETIVRNAHEFIIGKQLGFATVGLFSRAFGLIELFYTNFTSALLRVTTPLFAKGHRDGDDLAAKYSFSTTMLTAIAWPFFGFVAIMAPELIRVLFGSQWTEAAPIARILALAIMPTYLSAMGPSMLAATGQIKRRLLITAWYAPVHLVALLVASFWGPWAMAAAFGLSNTVQMLMYVSQLPKILGCRRRDLFRGCQKSATLALACISVQYLAAHICSLYVAPSLVALVLVGIAALLSWILVARLLSHPAYLELARLIKSRRPA